MKGIRFYADLPGTASQPVAANGFYPDNVKPDFGPRTTIKQLWKAAKDGKQCNVIALLTGDEHLCHDGSREALSAVTESPNSGVNLGAVSRDYLKGCRRIIESLARELHPQLFERLDAQEWD